MIALDDIKPLDCPTRGFAPAEFEGRLKRLQSQMQTQDVDCILLMSEHDIQYFTGFLTQFWQSPTRPWFLVVPADGEMIAVIPSIGEKCMEKTIVKDIRTWSSPNKTDDGITLLSDTLKSFSPKRIGMMMGRETQLRMPLLDFETLKRNLGAHELIDVSPIIQKLRSIKSEAEIEKIGHAAKIASTAFDLAPQLFEKGMSEIEVFRKFKIACLALGADQPSYLVGGADQGGYGDIISPPKSRKLQNGDVLILDVGCIWNGYFCDFDRNFSIGKPSQNIVDANNIIWDATQAAIENIKVGMSCADIFNIMNDVMSPHAIEGGGDVGRLGHGLGLQLTEHPSLTNWDETVVEEGMVLTLEPGFLFAEGKMLVHEENIVVRKRGVELLTKRASRDIIVIG